VLILLFQAKKHYSENGYSKKWVWKVPVPNFRIFLTVVLSSSLGALSSLGFQPQPVHAQALLPYVSPLDASDLEQKGRALAQDAAQLAQFQQFDLALSRAKLATQLAPQNNQVWAVLGSIYLQTNKLDDGIAALQQSKRLDAKTASIYFALGSAYFQQGKIPLAIEELQSGLKIKPNSTNALFDLGNAYLVSGQFPLAISQYEKAVAQAADFWPAINNIGLIEYERGNVTAALRHWQDASKLDEKAAEPRLAAAIALYSKGEKDKALSLGETALQIDRRYGDLKFLKENLWGAKLLQDAKLFLETPRIQATLAREPDPKPEPQPPK
jgi:tetratricopeptide (TPR) repeat protein